MQSQDPARRFELESRIRMIETLLTTGDIERHAAISKCLADAPQELESGTATAAAGHAWIVTKDDNETGGKNLIPASVKHAAAEAQRGDAPEEQSPEAKKTE